MTPSTTEGRTPTTCPGIELPGVSATHDPELGVAGAEFVVLAVPSQTFRENLTEWVARIPGTRSSSPS